MPPSPISSCVGLSRSAVSVRISHTPICVKKSPTRHQKNKTARFISPSSRPRPALQSTHSNIQHDDNKDIVRVHFPGDSSPDKPTTRLIPKSLLVARSVDLAQLSPDRLASFKNAMTNFQSLLDTAMASPSRASPPPPLPVTTSPSPPQPIVTSSPPPKPVVTAPSTPSAPSTRSTPSTPSAAARPVSPIVTRAPPSKKTLLTTPRRTLGLPRTRDGVDPAPEVRRDLRRVAKLTTAWWIEHSYSPDANLPLTSSPVWSFRSQSTASSGATTVCSPGSNSAVDSQDASPCCLPLPEYASLLGMIAGLRFWRMPKRSTRTFTNTLVASYPSFLSPTPRARLASIDDWLHDLPDASPLRRGSPSFLARVSPVPTSLFSSKLGSSRGSSRARGLPAMSPLASSSASASASSSSRCTASVDRWLDDQYGSMAPASVMSTPSDRPVPRRLYDLSPVPSSLFSSSLGSPKDPQQPEFGIPVISRVTPSPKTSPAGVDLLDQRSLSSLSLTSAPPLPLLPASPLSLVSSPSPATRFTWMPSLDFSSPVDSKLLPLRPIAPKPSTRSFLPPPTTRSPPPRPRKPTLAQPIRPPFPVVLPPSKIVSPSPTLSWKIAAGIAAGAFALGYVAARYLF